jgi:hypothetical protein
MSPEIVNRIATVCFGEYWQKRLAHTPGDLSMALQEALGPAHSLPADAIDGAALAERLRESFEAPLSTEVASVPSSVFEARLNQRVPPRLIREATVRLGPVPLSALRRGLAEAKQILDALGTHASVQDLEASGELQELESHALSFTLRIPLSPDPGPRPLPAIARGRVSLPYLLDRSPDVELSDLQCGACHEWHVLVAESSRARGWCAFPCRACGRYELQLYGAPHSKPFLLDLVTRLPWRVRRWHARTRQERTRSDHARDAASRHSPLGVVVVGLAVVLAAVALFGPRSGDGGARARYAEIPRIDVHVHLPPEQAERAVRLFREQGGVYLALNASGGHPDGGGLEENVEVMHRTGGALRPYCSIDFRNVEEPDWQAYVERTLHACASAGAVGMKVYKGLGLGVTLSDGSLLTVDDPRLDRAFSLAGELRLPVLIHSGDPQAFFRPDGPDNERHAELEAHPSWSFHGPRPGGGAWPSWQTVFDQYERRVARHPGTTFVGAHFGNAPEEPETVARMLDTYPNLVVETAARIPEIGRHDARAMRALFVRHADRILFGTDFQIGGDGALVLGSAGRAPDPPWRVPAFYDAHFRYFETSDRGFAHPTPIQGDWTIEGVALPRDVLEQLYYRNAMRVFELPAPEPASTAGPRPR